MNTNVDTSAADGAPPLPSATESPPHSLGVRAVALLSAFWFCLVKKATQHDAADAETDGIEFNPKVMNGLK